MLDDVFQAGTDAALNDLARRPAEVPQASANFSLWRTLTAVPRGGLAGGAETLAFGADVLGAFGDVTAAYGQAGDPAAFLGPDRDARQKESEVARLRVESADAFSTGTGDNIRAASHDMFVPDAATAHAAEQTVFGFSRLVGKAVGYGVAAGPLGPLFVAADEGVTQADELRLQGVDVGTRTQAGLLGGIAAGAGVALPVVGAGIKSTAALVAAGGPGMFIAQQSATREILANAGYDKIAEQYNPFDPVGLTLSALVPAAFGGFALRGRARDARAADAARAGETIPPDAAPPPGAHPEAVDAARVQLVRDTVDSWSLGKPGDIQAANQHLLAFMRAGDQLANGGRVAINDLVPLEKAQTAKAIDQMIGRLEGARADLVAQTADLADPGAVTAMRSELEQVRQQAPDATDAGIRVVAKDIQANDQVSYKTALSRAKKVIAEQVTNHESRIERLESALARNAEANQAQQSLLRVDEQLQQTRAMLGEVDAPATDLNPVAAAVRDLGSKPAATGTKVPEAPRAGTLTQARPSGSSAPAAPGGTASRGTTKTEPAAKVGEGGTAAGADPIEARAAQVIASNPDLMVQFEGMDAPMRLADAMEQITKDAAQDAADVPLIQAAANCFLSL